MEYAHASFATIAIALGGIQMFRRKHGTSHKLIGRAYLGAMTFTALSSFFLTSMTGTFSFLHILSVWTLITLVQTLWHLRRGNIIGHAYSMIWLYGGLLTAGILAANRHGLDLPPVALAAVLLALWSGVIWVSSQVRSSAGNAI
jgi:uncharacterized membrane protein